MFANPFEVISWIWIISMDNRNKVKTQNLKVMWIEIFNISRTINSIRKKFQDKPATTNAKK